MIEEAVGEKIISGEYKLTFARYATTGNLSIRVQDAVTHEPVMSITVNTSSHVADPLIAVKNYSENEGILKQLIDAGIVSNPYFRSPLSMHVSADICEFLLPLPEDLEPEFKPEGVGVKISIQQADESWFETEDESDQPENL